MLYTKLKAKARKTVRRGESNGDVLRQELSPRVVVEGKHSPKGG